MLDPNRLNFIGVSDGAVSGNIPPSIIINLDTIHDMLNNLTVIHGRCQLIERAIVANRPDMVAIMHDLDELGKAEETLTATVKAMQAEMVRDGTVINRTNGI